MMSRTAWMFFLLNVDDGEVGLELSLGFLIFDLFFRSQGACVFLVAQGITAVQQGFVFLVATDVDLDGGGFAVCRDQQVL